MLRSRVAAAIRLHRIFQPGERVLVAVSGGPDSVALLSLLRELMPRIPLHLTVAHFDHGWRPESPADAAFVEELADAWGYGHVSGRAQSGLPRTEAAARQARYHFLRESARATASSAIALGHTRDDQVETLLLHLLRGSGSRGLAGMRHRHADLARPMLDVQRAEIERYLTSLGLTPRRDPSNDDPRFARNRLRQVVLPAIDAFNPAARRLLAQTAQILGEEDSLLEDQVEELAEAVVADPNALRALPPAIQRRFLRRFRPDDGFIRTEARRREAGATGAPEAKSLPELRVSTCSCDPAGFKARDPVGHLDADRVRMPLTVAVRKAGDRMRPLGMAQEKRVQDLLVDSHVPRHLRGNLAIVCDREEIVWIPSVSVAESKRVTQKTRRQLHLEIASS
ncbi:MAG: tRNA lysidine(34) synthetase TilS [Candidatus Dormibacteria bacterium]